MTNGGSFNMGMMAGRALNESIIKQPSETIVFGEKETQSEHYYMDFMETAVGNDFEEVEQSRHMSNGKTSGGSDFCFADGSARYLPFGKMTAPQNLWAVTDPWRFSQ